MTWKPIPEYEGRYEASDEGQIRNCRTGKVIRHHLTHDGYPRLTLRRPGEQRLYTVHVLVARAFIGPRPLGATVDHIDGNKLNPAATNLEYVTPKENSSRAAKMGLMARGPRQHSAKLTAEKVQEIRRRRAAGERGNHLAKEFGVSNTAVGYIVSGRNWAWLEVEAKIGPDLASLEEIRT